MRDGEGVRSAPTPPSLLRRVVGFARRPAVRAIILIAVDSAAWLAALAVGTALRLDFQYWRIDTGGLTRVAIFVVAGQITWGFIAGLYPGRWRTGSFREAGTVGLGAVLIGLADFTWVYFDRPMRPIPLSVTVSSAAVFTLFALGARFSLRLVREVRGVADHQRDHRALFFGAGEGGHEAVRALMRDEASTLLPVGFLDDDPAKARLRIEGTRVWGTRADIASVAGRLHADTLVITMPSAPRAAVAEVSRLARAAGLQVLILPGMARFLATGIESGLIRPLRFEDFLGRDPVALDLGAMHRFIEGRRVLVTGAGGSIGSELCAAVSRLHPEALVMVDRDENALHALSLRLDGRPPHTPDRQVIADIRDRERMLEVLAEARPDVVFHAAALKHVAFLESYPEEGVKTNVIGTANVLEAAATSGVGAFVNISTDKAAAPVNVLGRTKRLGEMLTAGFDGPEMRALSVRFGNVLGTSGSVIPTFQRQILDGGPITITHPDVTRFFMTVQEAVQLVIQAATVGSGGRVFVLDMGSPVRILDLAGAMAAELEPGTEIAVEYIGLRPGERLHEVLVGPDEVASEFHEGVTGYAVPAVSPDEVASLIGTDGDTIAGRLEWFITRASRRRDVRDAG
jgi:FlaA1/EpsC-like NDP-sugar epimerase